MAAPDEPGFGQQISGALDVARGSYKAPRPAPVPNPAGVREGAPNPSRMSAAEFLYQENERNRAADERAQLRTADDRAMAPEAIGPLTEEQDAVVQGDENRRSGLTMLADVIGPAVGTAAAVGMAPATGGTSLLAAPARMLSTEGAKFMLSRAMTRGAQGLGLSTVAGASGVLSNIGARMFGKEVGLVPEDTPLADPGEMMFDFSRNFLGESVGRVASFALPLLPKAVIAANHAAKRTAQMSRRGSGTEIVVGGKRVLPGAVEAQRTVRDLAATDPEAAGATLPLGSVSSDVTFIEGVARGSAYGSRYFERAKFAVSAAIDRAINMISKGTDQGASRNLMMEYVEGRNAAALFESQSLYEHVDQVAARYGHGVESRGLLDTVEQLLRDQPGDQKTLALTRLRDAIYSETERASAITGQPTTVLPYDRMDFLQKKFSKNAKHFDRNNPALTGQEKMHLAETARVFDDAMLSSLDDLSRISGEPGLRAARVDARRLQSEIVKGGEADNEIIKALYLKHGKEFTDLMASSSDPNMITQVRQVIMRAADDANAGRSAAARIDPEQLWRETAQASMLESVLSSPGVYEGVANRSFDGAALESALKDKLPTQELRDAWFPTPEAQKNLQKIYELANAARFNARKPSGTQPGGTFINLRQASAGALLVSAAGAAAFGDGDSKITTPFVIGALLLGIAPTALAKHLVNPQTTNNFLKLYSDAPQTHHYYRTVVTLLSDFVNDEAIDEQQRAAIARARQAAVVKLRAQTAAQKPMVN